MSNFFFIRPISYLASIGVTEAAVLYLKTNNLLVLEKMLWIVIHPSLFPVEVNLDMVFSICHQMRTY